jgi:hypothetical protein
VNKRNSNLFKFNASGFRPRQEYPEDSTSGFDAHALCEVKLELDLDYRKSEKNRYPFNKLDVYYNSKRTEKSKQQAIIFIHGGNWRAGDKSCVGGVLKRSIPEWFVLQGFVFVSINFRLFTKDEVNLDDMLDDVGKAIKWVVTNGWKYGALGNDILLMGYSSGAHLATLISSNTIILRRYHLSPSVISGVIGLDVPFYDVPYAIRELMVGKDFPQTKDKKLFAAREVMGTTKVEQLSVSPAAMIGPWMKHVHFLLISAGFLRGLPQDLSRRASAYFARLLKKNGNEVMHEHFSFMDHEQLLPLFLDGPSEVVLDFLDTIKKLE